jgi:AcrR family transcriptional regulator
LTSAALAVIDRDGLSGLSMRGVAKQLGMSTMALYRYVRDREELEGWVLEFVLATVDTEPPSDGPWRERITVMVGRMRRAMSAHPSIVPLTLTHRHNSPGLLRWSETLLGILEEPGLKGEQRVVALRALLSYVIGAIQLEHLGPLAGEGTVAIAALPLDEFPLMAATGKEARGVDADREFFGGLELLLRGLND